jgi:hypothetical protein
MNAIKLPAFDFLNKVKPMSPGFNQFFELWKRNVHAIKRSPQVIFASLGVAAFNGLLMMAIFYKQFYPFPPDGITNIDDITNPATFNEVTLEIHNSIGALFCLVMQILLASCY